MEHQFFSWNVFGPLEYFDFLISVGKQNRFQSVFLVRCIAYFKLLVAIHILFSSARLDLREEKWNWFEI